jgi:hypothetical protein
VVASVSPSAARDKEVVNYDLFDALQSDNARLRDTYWKRK